MIDEHTNNTENNVIRLNTQMDTMEKSVKEIKDDLKKLHGEIHNGFIDSRVERCMQRWVGKIIIASVIGSGGVFGLIELLTKL